MNIVKDTIKELLQICETLPARVRGIPSVNMSTKPAPAKWSKKEILGHLCDSAMVNISRLLRGRVENNPHIFYQQEEYVAMQQYQDYDTEKLICLWEALNRHYTYAAACIPQDDLLKTCLSKQGEPQTLEYLIADYLVHLKHHVQQLLNQE